MKQNNSTVCLPGFTAWDEYNVRLEFNIKIPRDRMCICIWEGGSLFYIKLKFHLKLKFWIIVRGNHLIPWGWLGRLGSGYMNYLKINCSCGWPVHLMLAETCHNYDNFTFFFNLLWDFFLTYSLPPAFTAFFVAVSAAVSSSCTNAVTSVSREEHSKLINFIPIFFFFLQHLKLTLLRIIHSVYRYRSRRYIQFSWPLR